MRLPSTSPIDQRDTHRLVPSRYSPRGESVLVRIADSGDDAHLASIFELEGATNDRLVAERGLLPGIGLDELVAAVPLASVINAAFCHAHPLGSRFGGADRGAWYGGFEIETSHAEVAFHKATELAEIGWPDESITYDDYQADFAGDFPDLRDGSWASCLSPTSYAASQTLAARLLEAGAPGVVYPSVRRDGGTCLACFRPALVGRVRRTGTWRFTWEGGQGPRIETEATAARTRAAAAGRSRRRREHDGAGD
ncbi:MAG: RES family NAD+ phosphorylase [Vicinamibacteraceae bacterium]